jgi:hypothetical protein
MFILVLNGQRQQEAKVRHFTCSQKKKQSAFRGGEKLFICDLFNDAVTSSNYVDVSSCVVVGTVSDEHTDFIWNTEVVGSSKT